MTPTASPSRKLRTGQALGPVWSSGSSWEPGWGAGSWWRAASFREFRGWERLARGLASVVNLLDPDVLVVGGGLSHLPGLLDGLPERMAPWLFNDEARTPVVGNLHGDSSGVRGAAWLWP